MRVFVAGATGVIGRRLIPRLVEDGHQVAGMTRSPDKAARLTAMGAIPVVCDAYHQAKLTAVLSNSPSDVVVHLLTDLPARLNPAAGTTATNRLRREGTRNLLQAARAAGTRRFIAESIAFLYRPGSPAPKNEQDPPWLDAPGCFAETVRAVVDLEQQVLRAPSLNGVILRFGWLYGPGTWYAPDGSIAWDVRDRRYPVVGEGRGMWSFLHVDDAAAAVFAAAEQGRPGIYNIVDDDPAPMHAWLPAFAKAIGAPKPPHIQNALARPDAGRGTADIASQLAGASNTKAKNELGWKPQYPSWRACLGALPGPAPAGRRERASRTVTPQDPRSRALDRAEAVHPLCGAQGLNSSSHTPLGPAQLPVMLDAATRDQLLRRIGLTEVPAADAAGLRAVHRAFVSRVPYENIAVQLGESEHLEPHALVQRVLHGGRGGYCFEANTVLQALLEALGFTVERRQGIVGPRDAHRRGEPANHIALVAHTPDAGPFIAEAGLGEGPLEPLPLAAGPVTAGAFQFTIEREGEGWWVAQHAYGSIPGFRFSDAPATLADFQPHHARLSTSAGSSFVQTLVVQRPSDDHIVTLRARTLFVNGPGRCERRVLGDAPAFGATLRDRFGIDPGALGPERLRRLWAKATHQHKTHQALT